MPCIRFRARATFPDHVRLNCLTSEKWANGHDWAAAGDERHPTVALHVAADAVVVLTDDFGSPTGSFALASLVLVASGYPPRPSRTTASSMAPVRRTEMDFGHHQAVWDRDGLPEASDSRE
jgi:hypothetical protein